MNSWYMPFGWILMVFWWILVVVGIVAILKWISGSRRSDEAQAGKQSPLEILQERYAKGELTKKEYEDKKKDLT